MLRQYVEDGDTTPNQGAYYEFEQDPITGAFEREWEESDPDSGSNETLEILCAAQVLTGARTQERFDEEYEYGQRLKLRYSPKQMLTVRDRVTKIRNLQDYVVWVELAGAVPQSPGIFVVKATVFEIDSIYPIVSPFGDHIENVAVLVRADVQDGPEVTRTFA